MLSTFLSIFILLNPEEEYWAAITGNDSIPHFDNCTFRECEYGSSNDQQSMSKVSYTGFLVYAGCFAATLSSAIASLVGAPRVLQALARDKLYPLIGFFGIGYGANDDPFRGIDVLRGTISLAW